MALSYRTKLAVDHTIGVVIAVAFKTLARVLTVLLRRDHGIPAAPRCVAVAKIVGLGSVVYSANLCRGLKAKWPVARLIYVTGRDTAELVSRMPAVDEVLVLDDRNAITLLASGTKLVLTLWRRRPALYFDLEVYSSFAAILASLSLAVNRYGFYRKSAGFKRNLHTHMIFFNTRRHIDEIYGQMLSCVEGPRQRGLRASFALTPTDLSDRDGKLAELGLSQAKLILVNPNASELMLERRWPREHWARFLGEAAKRYEGYTWAVVGSPRERAYVETILAMVPGPAAACVHNLAGSTTLGGYLALLQGAALLVTNDSGPLHLALAFGCPTVSLWGPGAPEHYMPRSGAHEVVYTQTYCSPCLYHADFPPCNGDNVCMKHTSVDTVLAATDRIMARLQHSPDVDREARRGDAVHVSHQDLRGFSPVIVHGQKR
jgi:ADP-heptose:LPS heptosyltransferase